MLTDIQVDRCIEPSQRYDRTRGSRCSKSKGDWTAILPTADGKIVRAGTENPCREIQSIVVATAKLSDRSIHFPMERQERAKIIELNRFACRRIEAKNLCCVSWIERHFQIAIKRQQWGKC